MTPAGRGTATRMSGNDPRSIDPADTEQDEADVARQDGSSTPLADEEERTGEDHTVGRDAEKDALAAMPADDGTPDDQVVSRQPDSQDH